MDELNQPVRDSIFIKDKYRLTINMALGRWSAALPSLLGSRLILSMREAVEKQNDSTTYIMEEFPSVVYARNGNVRLGSDSSETETEY